MARTHSGVKRHFFKVVDQLVRDKVVKSQRKLSMDIAGDYQALAQARHVENLRIQLEWLLELRAQYGISVDAIIDGGGQSVGVTGRTKMDKESALEQIITYIDTYRPDKKTTKDAKSATR